MRMLVRKTHWLALGLALLTALLYWSGRADAHGKEVNIAVTCVAPDPGRPLTKACTASLKYLDGDPVTKANLELTATRQGAAELSLTPVKFKPLDQEGLYAATVTFPAYGRWRIRFTVREPDKGEAELIEELAPPVPGASSDVRARLQVVFAFGGADVRNLAIRVAHLLGAASWFALSGLALVLSGLPESPQRRQLLQRLAATFPPRAGVALAVVAATGVLSARYNAPTRPPGLFAPEVVAGLPFGEAYLAVFLVKMALGLAIIATTVALAISLRRGHGVMVPAVAGASEGFPASPARERNWVVLLAAVNIVLGLLLFVDVVLMGYVHIISHVGAAAGAG
ncbi:MAG: FixH family protein [Chloroflexi bacterium]|nr:FixH family protein [Chloroflexota bacterium]